jgi:hypothetical protein
MQDAFRIPRRVIAAQHTFEAVAMQHAKSQTKRDLAASLG